MVSGISAGISDSGSCLVWMVIAGIDDDRIDAGRTGRRDSEAGSRSSTVPVSYPHLDVYKRQPVEWWMLQDMEQRFH